MTLCPGTSSTRHTRGRDLGLPKEKQVWLKAGDRLNHDDREAGNAAFRADLTRAPAPE